MGRNRPEEDYEEQEEAEEQETEEKPQNKNSEAITIPVTQVPNKEQMEIENYINLKKILQILSKK